MPFNVYNPDGVIGDLSSFGVSEVIDLTSSDSFLKAAEFALLLGKIYYGIVEEAFATYYVILAEVG